MVRSDRASFPIWPLAAWRGFGYGGCVNQSESYGYTGRLTRLRFPAMVAGLAALLVGMAAGLERAGVGIPGLPAGAPLRHGPLMVSGFLGTLIAVERAVGIGRPWAWGAPLLSAVGAVMLLAGGPERVVWAAFAVAAVVLAVVYVVAYRMRPEASSVVLFLGALAWGGSAVRGVTGAPTVELVPWWMAFLVLTIAGARLELGRFRTPGRRATFLFAPMVALVVVGAVVSVVDFQIGVRVEGLGLVGLAGWLFRYDVARRTVRMVGQARYIATCLLGGFGWLGFSGAMLLAWPGSFAAGLRYDAMLHALFLGFVMAMIFGHALIILPGVMGVRVGYRREFYVHLALLHAGLGVRLVGDLAGWATLREGGAVLNVAAVVLFVVATGAAAISARSGAVRAASAAPTR